MPSFGWILAKFNHNVDQLLLPIAGLATASSACSALYFLFIMSESVFIVNMTNGENVFHHSSHTFHTAGCVPAKCWILCPNVESITCPLSVTLYIYADLLQRYN